MNNVQQNQTKKQESESESEKRGKSRCYIKKKKSIRSLDKHLYSLTKEKIAHSIYRRRRKPNYQPKKIHINQQGLGS